MKTEINTEENTAKSRLNTLNEFVAVSPAISNPTIKAFTITGKKKETTGIPLILIFLKSLVKIAAISEADVPKIQSTGPNGLPRFDKKHPMVSPGMAAGVKTGKIVRTSEILN